jgi:hypothetical protein
MHTIFNWKTTKGKTSFDRSRRRWDYSIQLDLIIWLMTGSNGELL